MTDEQEIERLTREWAEAVRRRDTESLERLLAPNFTFTTGHRGTLSRCEWLETTRDRYSVESYEFDASVSVRGGSFYDHD